MIVDLNRDSEGKAAGAPKALTAAAALFAVDRWLRRFADQQLSMADAVSFEVMRERGIRQALALDEHFTLAGFELVPR